MPESYLKAWADDRGRVAVRRRDQTDTFCTSTVNVAVESDLYAFPTDEGMDDALEVALSDVEGPLGSYLADLCDGHVPRKGTAVRDELGYLIGIQLIRTPEHLDRVMFPLEVAEFTDERPISPEVMRQFLTEVYLQEVPMEGEVQGALDFVNYQLMKVGLPTKREAFSLLFENAREQLAPRLARMAWSVEASREPLFLTSDRPVIVWTHPKRRSANSGLGIESAEEIRFPLSPNHLLVLRSSYPDRRYNFVGVERIGKVNSHLSAGCYEMVIGRPGRDSALEGLRLRAVRPALRFNSGPLYERDGNGDLVDTGKTILHIYTPDGEDM